MHALILATLLTPTLAFFNLFRDPNGCDGYGAACQSIPNGTCCGDHRGGRLWGSFRGVTVRDDDIGTMYAFSGDRSNICGARFKPARITICQYTGVAESVAGASWNFAGNEELGCAGGSVQGEEMYRDGSEGKMYIVSQGKMEGLVSGGLGNEGLMEDEEGLLEWFKVHADVVIDDSDDELREERLG